jgi:hypothetical protein
MLLGTKVHGAGNTIRYVIDYSTWLEEGESLSACTVALDPAFTATVTDITIGTPTVAPSNHVYFTLAGGTVNELFTLNAQATNNRGEIKNDTMKFVIVAP